MTGYKSKRAAAQDKLDDDDTQVYQDHDDALTIAYQSGYYDGKKAAHLAQEPVAYLCKPDQHGLFDRPTPDKACEDCFPVYAAPPQPAQKPVAWLYIEPENPYLNVHYDDVDVSQFPYDEWFPVYKSKPQRTWVGLTDEEINTAWKKWIGTERANKSYTKAIEAKLKEKNT